MANSKLLTTVTAIIEDPALNYWQKLVALRGLKYTSVPGAEAARQLVKAFASVETCPNGVKPTHWEYVRHALTHPFWGDGREQSSFQLSGHYVSSCFDLFQEWPTLIPRGTPQHAIRTSAHRFEQYLNARYPDFRMGTGRYDGIDDGWQSCRLSPLPDTAVHHRHQWRRADRPLAARAAYLHRADLLYAEYQRSGLPPQYATNKMSLGQFQEDAPRLVSEIERKRHVDPQAYHRMVGRSPYTQIGDTKITIGVTEYYDKDYLQYLYGAGKLTDTVRSVTLHSGDKTEMLTSEARFDATVAGAVLSIIAHSPEAFPRLNTTALQAELTSLATLMASSPQRLYAAAMDSSPELYHATFQGVAGDAVEACLKTHIVQDFAGFRGNWLLKLLVERFDIPRVTQPIDPSVQLSPYFTVYVRRQNARYTIFERRLIGNSVNVHWDWCVVLNETQTTYHGASVAKCLRGAQRKQQQAAVAAAHGNEQPLTYALVHKRYGFCWDGVQGFCEANGLDANNAYYPGELKPLIAANLERNRSFQRDLRSVGLWPEQVTP